MADAQQQPQDEDLIISFFPDPPPFYRKFTAENLERLKEIKKQATGTDSENENDLPSLSLDQILALPSELRYLIPPEPPADDEEFNVFGSATKVKGDNVFMKHMEFTKHRMIEEGVLEDWNYQQLYPSAADPTSSSPTSTSATLDRQKVLFRLLRSLLLAYMSLLGLVATDPVSPAKSDKVSEMLTMVMNMHALINEYRPHQARETLIGKMEMQVMKKRAEIEGVRKMAERVRTVLESFGNEADGLDKKAGMDHDSMDEKLALVEEEKIKKDTYRHDWEAMDEILGT